MPVAYVSAHTFRNYHLKGFGRAKRVKPTAGARNEGPIVTRNFKLKQDWVAGMSQPY